MKYANAVGVKRQGRLGDIVASLERISEIFFLIVLSIAMIAVYFFVGTFLFDHVVLVKKGLLALFAFFLFLFFLNSLTQDFFSEREQIYWE
ncbi:MAG: hypothetical protein US25_C0079G0004 [Candidatus Moranbacteria bacterium GW2011_GWE1_36_7]|nr:MAG: hypothetical protein US25_C0079G0004 [Candidatus Moranbacteria bacterium GW2011_GWE1_36_7]